MARVFVNWCAVKRGDVVRVFDEYRIIEQVEERDRLVYIKFHNTPNWCGFDKNRTCELVFENR